MYSDRRCLGLSRLFFIGSLALDLNAVGMAQRMHFLCQLILPRRRHFNTIHFDDLMRSRTESPHLDRFWEIPYHGSLLSLYPDVGLYVKRLYRIRQT